MVVGLSTGRHGPWLKGTEATQQKKKPKTLRNASLASTELPVFQKELGIQIFMRNYVVINKN